MDKTIDINGYIVEKGDPFYEMWFGKPDPYLFASDTFLEQIKDLKEGDTLNIDVFSDGGSCDAGIRIYNACKDLQKKGVNVVTFNRGKQHSIANVIILGGQVRKAYKASTGVIHLPYLPSEAMWFESGFTAADLELIASNLRLEEDRILDIYAAETGKDKEFLRGVMSAEKNHSATQLKDLGFITEIVDGAPQAQAQNKKAFAYVNIVKPKSKNVENTLNQVKEEMGLFRKALESLQNLIKPKSAVNMDFTSDDGKQLHVVREEGEIAVGDEATIDGGDGEITLSDGTYVKVEGGKITELTAPASGDDSEIENLKNEIAAKDATIANLEQELEAQKSNLNAIQSQLSTVNSKFSELENTVSNWEPQGRNAGSKNGSKKTVVGSVDLERVAELQNKLKNGK